MSQLIFIYCLMIRANVICFLQHSYNVTVILLQDNSFGVFNKKHFISFDGFMSERVTTRNLMDAVSVEGKASICRRFCVLWWDGPSV